MTRLGAGGTASLIIVTALLACSPNGEPEQNIAQTDAPKIASRLTDSGPKPETGPALATAEKSEQVESEYRPGVRVKFLYRQMLGDPYWTTWYGRLEKAEGDWRDIYVETGEKFTTSGVLSFRCNDYSTVAWITYDEDRFGIESARHIVRINSADQKLWKADELEAMSGEDPPFALLKIVAAKFC